MAEQFLIATSGGPFDDEVRVATDGQDGFSWPLPDILKFDHTGWYEKVSQSSLPPQANDSHVMRGAWYEWRQPA